MAHTVNPATEPADDNMQKAGNLLCPDKAHRAIRFGTSANTQS